MSTKPPDFFAKYVKNLVVNFYSEVEHIVAFLLKCTGIHTLACWLTTPITSNEVWATMNSLRGPTRLSVRLSPIDDGLRDFSAAIFQNLTRLEIVSVSGADWKWESLAGLGSLTHLSVEIPWLFTSKLLGFVRKILHSSFPPNLRVLVVFFSAAAGMEVEVPPRDVDDRVVFATGDDQPFDSDFTNLLGDEMIVRPVDDLVKDWAGRPVGRDFWTQAEQIIRRRRLAKGGK